MFFRLEELYRMRDHVMKQMDTNGDHRISLAEFLAVCYCISSLL